MTVDIELLAVGTAGRPPGVWAGRAPRRAHRRRSEERLVVFLTLEGAAPEAARQLAERLADLYYQTGGATTTAMREVSDRLNRYLLQRNLKQSGRGQHLVGHLLVVVVRSGRLVAGVSGAGHLYLSGPEHGQHFHAAEESARGLGVSRALRMRFFQAEIRAGDLLLLAPYLPTVWHGVLRHPAGELWALRQQLEAAAPTEVSAVLVRFRGGRGEVQWLPTEPPEEPVETPTVSQAAEPVPVAAQPAPPRAGRPLASALAPRLKRALRSLARLGRRLLSLLGQGLARTLPADIGRLPAGIMAGLAIVVPLIVVTVAAVVYAERGRAQQYQAYFQEAQALALQAPTLEDPTWKRTAWKATLEKLDQAERYRQTPESQALRRQAQAALDAMNQTTRLDFSPVIVGGLPANMQPAQLLVGGEDLFVLDRSRGVVWHYTRSGALKFTRDPDFLCGPGDYAGRIVSPLVDMALLPPDNEAGALIVAVDEAGNLVYCGGANGAMTRPLAPPAVPLGTVAAIELQQGDLYVLDPVGNGVYRYPGARGMFDALPELVFDQQVPNLRQAVDLAVTPDDLFVLYADGHMVSCAFGKTEAQPTRCQEPAHFQDTRLGVRSDVLLEDAQPAQVRFMPPPDPSLYLLDIQHGAVMHFSLRLVFQEQFQAISPLDGEITTFAVGPEGLLFVATPQQVYAAARP